MESTLNSKKFVPGWLGSNITELVGGRSLRMKSRSQDSRYTLSVMQKLHQHTDGVYIASKLSRLPRLLGNHPSM